MTPTLQTKEEKPAPAVCRGCGTVLIGKAYYLGGSAYHPRTLERCPVNQYGGFVCSYSCDHRASLELERTMPGHGSDQRRISCYAAASLARNWPES